MATKDSQRPVTERRVFNLTNCEVRSADGDGPAVFSGYAAVFNELSVNLGGFRERIQPGCFRNAVDEGQDVRFLINHDPNLILGRTVSGTLKLAEDEVGLRVECELGNQTYAQDLAESMRRGDVNQMSFGFSTVEDSWPEKDKETGLPIRELVRANLFDVSAVAYPAYPDTTAEVRSEIAEQHPELLERAQRAAEELAEPETRAEAHACGSTDLSLSDRDVSWDAGEAQGTLDAEDFPKAHFWYDGGPADEIGSYHLPFARKVDGKLQAVWKGVTAGAARLNQAEGVDDAAVQAKMEPYYRKAAEQYDDDSIKAPWETRELTDEQIAERAQAGARIVEDHDQCPGGWAVVWNFNDEMESCHTTEQAAQDHLTAISDGAAGAARDDDETEETRAGKVLASKHEESLRAAMDAMDSAAACVRSVLDAASAEGGEMPTDTPTNPGERAAPVRPDNAGFRAALEASIALAAEEGRAWDWDDDFALWILTEMAELASTYLLCVGNDNDGDGDDAALPLIRDFLARVGEAIAAVTADVNEPGDGARTDDEDETEETREDDEERATAIELERRRLKLVELELTL